MRAALPNPGHDFTKLLIQISLQGAAALLLSLLHGELCASDEVNRPPCRILKVVPDQHRPMITPIKRRGRYCLTDNVAGEGLHKDYYGTKGYGYIRSMLTVMSPTVVIDFLGNSVSSQFLDIGNSRYRRGASGIGGAREVGKLKLPARKLSLLNGDLMLVGISDGVGIPPLVSEHVPWFGVEMTWQNYGAKKISKRKRWFAEVIRRPTDNLVDNMSIKAGLTGVTMMGQRNTIRNSRIEMNDALAAINLFGPDNLIENNILIFRGEGRRPSAAPVILHAGGRTVIRNNVIIVDSPRPNQAVSLTASEGVVLENNRVYGALRFVREFDQLSSFVSRGNRMLAPAPKGLVPRDARRADEVPLF